MDAREPGRQTDPWAVLGVDVNAGDEEVRAAYIEKVRQHPPDRDQERFEQIRDAYGLLRDPRRRAEQMILSVDPEQALPSLLDDRSSRRYVGPDPWLAALKRR